jgi:hypothetical protein
MTGKKMASKDAFLTVNKNVENSSEFTHNFINTTTTKKKFKGVRDVTCKIGKGKVLIYPISNIKCQKCNQPQNLLSFSFFKFNWVIIFFILVITNGEKSAKLMFLFHIFHKKTKLRIYMLPILHVRSLIP